MEKLIVKSSRRQFALLLLGCVAFVFTSILMVTKGHWFGWVGALFFGPALIYCAWQLLDSRPRLVIDEDGVTDRTLGVGRIDFVDIKAAWIISIAGNDFICLELHDPAKYASRLSRVRRALASLNRRGGFTEFSLNLGNVDAKTEDVFNFLQKRWARTQPGRNWR